MYCAKLASFLQSTINNSFGKFSTFDIPRRGTSFLLDQPVCKEHSEYEKLRLLEGMIISRCTHKNWLPRTLFRRFRPAVLFQDISRQRPYTSQRTSIHRVTFAQISSDEILIIHIPFKYHEFFTGTCCRGKLIFYDVHILKIDNRARKCEKSPNLPKKKEKTVILLKQNPAESI